MIWLCVDAYSNVSRSVKPGFEGNLPITEGFESISINSRPGFKGNLPITDNISVWEYYTQNALNCNLWTLGGNVCSEQFCYFQDISYTGFILFYMTFNNMTPSHLCRIAPAFRFLRLTIYRSIELIDLHQHNILPEQTHVLDDSLNVFERAFSYVHRVIIDRCGCGGRG